MSRGTPRKRGRPPKFGRESRLISLTLPQDVLSWLDTIDTDVAWAIVKLHERATRARVAQVQVAQLVRFPGDRALILVSPELFGDVPGVALIPLSDGRAFLALENGKGVADLELCVLDRIEGGQVSLEQRQALVEFRQMLKQWRADGIRFEGKSIVVAHGPGAPSVPSLKARRKPRP